MRLEQLLEIHTMLEKLLNEGFKLRDYFVENNGITAVLTKEDDEEYNYFYHFSL